MPSPAPTDESMERRVCYKTHPSTKDNCNIYALFCQ